MEIKQCKETLIKKLDKISIESSEYANDITNDINSFGGKGNYNNLSDFIIDYLHSEKRSYFTISSKDTFNNFETENVGYSFIYTPLNDHSRLYMKKGDVVFCYRQGQFDSLDEALDKRGIYAVGMVLSNPQELYLSKTNHERWGVAITLPFIIKEHLELRNIQLNPKTINLTPYNGNRNDALQYIAKEEHFSTLLSMIGARNDACKEIIRKITGYDTDGVLPVDFWKGTKPLASSIKDEFRIFLKNCCKTGRASAGNITLTDTAVSSYVSYLDKNNLFGYDLTKWAHITSMYDITDVNQVRTIVDTLYADPDFKKWDLEKSYWPSGAIVYYLCFLRAKQLFSNVSSSITIDKNIKFEYPLQQIFYGAPGTGKSHTIKEQTKGDDTVIRTTFHPDSDYSTFVGCYKPTMSEKPKPIYGFDATGKTVKVEDPKGTVVEERKIEYKFIQQAFTKAYIQAWKKMVDYHPISRTFYVGSTKYDIIGISGDLVRVKVSDREDSEDIEIRKSELEDIFKTKDSHDVEQNHGKEEQNRNKELWNNPNELGLNNPNEIKPDPSDIDKIKERLGGDIFKGIDKSFDDAWTFLEKGFLKPQFLIIEEINRGNCAQIFGDLFQLLDRGDDGYSEYPIEADDDLRKELEREFDKLNLDALKHEIDSIFKENYPHGITDKIKSGKLLVLPKNLFIWATMNTSDQSLFPIDSAFKRRWEWKYQPIIKGVDEKTGKELDWKIKIDGYQPVDWWEFIERINNVIFNLTSSEDKQLGYFFCKPESKEKTTISAKRFVEKVIFYLWNDVFKDYSYDPECCNKKDKKDEKVQYSDFYTSDGKDIDTEVIANFINQLKTKDGKESPLAIKE